MKRNALPGIAMLSLVAAIFHLLLFRSTFEQNPAAAEPRLISRSAKAAKTSKLASFPADLQTTAETASDSGNNAETFRQITDDAELPALCDSLARNPSDAETELRQRSVRRWAEVDGAAAAAWASKLAPGATYQEALTQVALGWSSSDSSRARDWVKTLSAGDSREAVILQLGYETARTDATKALEVAGLLEPATQREDLIQHAISQLATTDFAGAVRWAESNASEPGLRQRLLAAVAVAVAGQDGSAAATLAATALTPGEEQDRVAVAIVQRWVQKEPEMAASWVAQFPDTPAREMTTQNLVAFWAAQDREAAEHWVRGLPEGTLRNVGMAAYAQAQPATEITATQ